MRGLRRRKAENHEQRVQASPVIDIEQQRAIHDRTRAEQQRLKDMLDTIRADHYGRLVRQGDDFFQPKIGDGPTELETKVIVPIAEMSEDLTRHGQDVNTIIKMITGRCYDEACVDLLATQLMNEGIFRPRHTAALEQLGTRLDDILAGNIVWGHNHYKNMQQRTWRHTLTAIDSGNSTIIKRQMGVAKRLSRNDRDPIRARLSKLVEKFALVEVGELTHARDLTIQPDAQNIKTALKQGRLDPDSEDFALYLHTVSMMMERVEEYKAEQKDNKLSASDRQLAGEKSLALRQLLDQVKVLVVQANKIEEEKIVEAQAEDIRAEHEKGPARPASYVDLDAGIARIVLPSKARRIAFSVGAGAVVATGIASPAAADAPGQISTVSLDSQPFNADVPLGVVETTEPAPEQTGTTTTFVASDKEVDIPDGVPHVASSDAPDIAIQQVEQTEGDLKVKSEKEAVLSRADQLFEKWSQQAEANDYTRENGEGYLQYQKAINSLIDQLTQYHDKNSSSLSEEQKARFARDIAWTKMLLFYPQLRSNGGVDPTKLASNNPEAQASIEKWLEQNLAGIRARSDYTTEEMKAVEKMLGDAYVTVNKQQIKQAMDEIKKQEQAAAQQNHTTSSAGEVIIDNKDDPGEYDNGNYRRAFLMMIDDRGDFRFTPAGAAGVLGSGAVESGMNPQRVQRVSADEPAIITSPVIPEYVMGGKRGYGLFQVTWHTRQDDMVSYAKATGRSTGDFELQMDFMLKEMNERMPDLLRTLRSTNNVEQAATMFTNVYENPGKPDMDRRVSIAREAYDVNVTQVKHDSKDQTKPAHTTGNNQGGTLKDVIKNYPGVDRIVSETNTKVPLPNKLGDVVYFSQWDKRWFDKPYNPSGVEGRTMWSSGCGPTTQAMAISTVTGKMVYPYEMARWNQGHGFRVDGGTSHAAFTASAEAFGANAQQIPNTADNIRQALQNGRLVIVNGQDSQPDTPATSSGHIYLVRGIDKNGNFLVSDANSITKSLRSYSPSEIAAVSTVAVAVWG